MPQVPTYPSGGTVSVDGLPSVRQSSVASAEVLGGGSHLQEVGRGLIRTGQVVQKIEEQEDANAVMQAEVKTREALIEHQRQMQSRRGVDAKGVYEDTEKWWNEQAVTITEKLTERQKEAYRKRLSGLRISSLNSMSQYEATQGRAAHKEGVNATIALAIEQANADPTDPLLRESALETVKARVAELAASEGATPETHQAMLLERTSQLHSGIAAQLADADPEAARAYVERYGDQMTAAARGTINKTVLASEQLRKIQDAADEIMLRGVSQAEAMHWIEKNASGDIEKELKQEVKARYQEQKTVKDELEKKAFDTAWTIEFDQGGQIPASLWANLTARQKESILDERYQRAERADKQATKASQEEVDRLSIMAVEDPQGFASMDLRTVKLTSAHRAKLAAQQDKIRKAKPDQLANVGTMITTAADMAGISNDKKHREKRALFINRAQVELEAYAESKGREVSTLTRDEVQPILDRMLVEGEVLSGKWYAPDADKAYFELRPEEVDNFEPTVPAEDRSLIEQQFLSRYNREPTKEEVRQIYRNWKGL